MWEIDGDYFAECSLVHFHKIMGKTTKEKKLVPKATAPFIFHLFVFSLFPCFPLQIHFSTENRNLKPDLHPVNQRSSPMEFLTEYPKHTWQPIMTADTTTKSYWMNWRFFLCVTWVLVSMIFAFFIVYKFEGFRKLRNKLGDPNKKENEGLLYEDEVWKPSLKTIHPAWLLGFRIVAFVVLIVVLLINSYVDGGSIFHFYTEWTFILVTFYFALGSLLSIYGCYQYKKKVGGSRIGTNGVDAEECNYPTTTHTGFFFMFNEAKNVGNSEECFVRKTAGIWCYIFQITFQISAGAVLLTDCVFWFIIVPFLRIKDYHLTFLIITMHSINAVFLIGDTTLNCLRFPWFRIAYFLIWTSMYVIFQWVVHACISFWWPYPFLDFSLPLAPLWYSLVALMHIPCYVIFALIMKSKHHLLSKWFPHSYQCMG